LPPMICRGGAIIDPRVEGVPLGLLDDRAYDEVVFEAQPDDLILFYSDGVEDQLGNGDKDFGRDRLIRRIKKSCNLEPQALVNAVFTDIDKFRGPNSLTDDQTLMALRVL